MIYGKNTYNIKIICSTSFHFSTIVDPTSYFKRNVFGTAFCEKAVKYILYVALPFI